MFNFNLKTVSIPNHNTSGYVISKDEHGCRVICDFCDEREIRVLYIPNEKVVYTNNAPEKSFDLMVWLLLMTMKENDEKAFFTIPFVNERKDILQYNYMSGEDSEKLSYDFLNDVEFQITLTQNLEEIETK